MRFGKSEMKKLAMLLTMLPLVTLADLAYPSNPMDDPRTALGVYFIPALSFLIGCALVCALHLCVKRKVESRQSSKAVSMGAAAVVRAFLVTMTWDLILLLALGACLSRPGRECEVFASCLWVIGCSIVACFTFWLGYCSGRCLSCKRWFFGSVLVLLAAGGVSFMCVLMIELPYFYGYSDLRIGSWCVAILLHLPLGFVAGFETGWRRKMLLFALLMGTIASCAFVVGTYWTQVVTECQTCISHEYNHRWRESYRRFEECPCCGGRGCHFRCPWRTPCTPCEEVFEKQRQRADSLIGTGEGWDVHSVYDFAFTPSFDRKVPKELEEAMIKRLRLKDLSDLFVGMKMQCADCGVDVESVNRLERWILSNGKRSDTLLGKVDHFGGKRECFCIPKSGNLKRGGQESRWATTVYTDCRLLNVFGAKVKTLYNFRRFYLAAIEEGYTCDAGLTQAIQDRHILDETDCIVEALDRKAWRTWSGWEQGCKLIDTFIDGAQGVEPVDQRKIHAMAEKLILRLKEMRKNDGTEFKDVGSLGDGAR